MPELVANEGLFRTLGEYIQSFKPTLVKKDILVDIQNSSEELTTSTIISLERLNTAGPKLYSTAVSKVLFSLKLGEQDYVKAMLNIANNVDGNIEMLSSEIDKSFPDNIYKNSMDYRQVNLLKYVEAINFFNEYVSKCNQVMCLDSLRDILNIMGKSTHIGEKVTAKVINLDVNVYFRNCNTFINDPNNISSFGNVINILKLDFNEYLKKIKDLNGHVYNPSDFGAVKTPTNRLIDPLNSGFVNVRWNPFYHIGIAYTSWRAKRNERAKAELQTINLTVILLQEQKTATDSKEAKEKIVGQIEYWTNLSNKLEAQLIDYEESST